jgi:hypothetical protein
MQAGLSKLKYIDEERMKEKEDWSLEDVWWNNGWANCFTHLPINPQEHVWHLFVIRKIENCRIFTNAGRLSIGSY